MANTNFHAMLLDVQSNLLNFAYTLTSNRDDAYDLLQDTTLKALDNEHKFVENHNFHGWVFTIMHNIFINNYRQSLRTAMHVDRTDDILQHSMPRILGHDTPEGSIAVQEISDAINGFAYEYRQPFAMHVAGYKYEEIAEEMTLPIGTVKSRIFFARRKLQELLRDYR